MLGCSRARPHNAWVLLFKRGQGSRGSLRCCWHYSGKGLRIASDHPPLLPGVGLLFEAFVPNRTVFVDLGLLSNEAGPSIAQNQTIDRPIPTTETGLFTKNTYDDQDLLTPLFSPCFACQHSQSQIMHKEHQLGPPSPWKHPTLEKCRTLLAYYYYDSSRFSFSFSSTIHNPDLSLPLDTVK